MRDSIVTVGRRRRSGTEVEAVLAQYGRSGLTQSEFAQRVGIGLSTLSVWLRRARREGRASIEERPQLVPVRVTERASVGSANKAQDAFAIGLPSGVSISVPARFDADSLRLLLAVVDTTC